MARLQYDISAVGEGKLKAVLRGIEREIDASDKRTRAKLNRPSRTRMATRAVADPEIKAAQKVASERIRLENRVFDEKARLVKRMARFQVQVEQRGHRQRIRDIEREKASMRRGVARSTGSAISGTTRLAAGSAGLLGGFAAGAAIRSEFGVKASSAALANQAYREGSGTSREQIQQRIESQARPLGTKTGIGAQGILDMLGQGVAISGNLDVMQQLAPFMADLAQGSGADAGDVGRTVGQIVMGLEKSQGLQGSELLSETEEILKSMYGQAKVGSIEFADLAKNMGSLISATANFDGKASDLATTMGAVAQLAIAGAATSPEEAMTAIRNFSDDLVQNNKAAKRLEGGGVNVFTDKKRTTLRAPELLLGEILEKTGGDLTKVQKIFGKRARKAVGPFQKLFAEKGGGEAGLKAVKDLLASVTGTKASKNEIAQSAQFRRDQPDAQAARAMEEFNQAVGMQLVPVITQQVIPAMVEWVPTMARAASAFARFMGFLLENPFAGIGVILGGKITAELASARIGPLVSKALDMQIKTKMGGVTLGDVAMTAAAVTMAIELGQLGIDALFDKGDDIRKQTLASDIETQNLVGKAKTQLTNGGLPLETLQELQKKRDELDTRASSAVTLPGFFESVKNSIFNEGTGFFDVAAGGTARTEQSQSLIAQSEQIAEILRLALDGPASKLEKGADSLKTASDQIVLNQPNRTKPIGKDGR